MVQEPDKDTQEAIQETVCDIPVVIMIGSEDPETVQMPYMITQNVVHKPKKEAQEIGYKPVKETQAEVQEPNKEAQEVVHEP